MTPRLGIIGLPNAGKSTLFNALTAGTAAQVGDYPFTTIQPNVGVASVPDERLAAIARLYRPPRVTPATITLVDIAGLVQGASRGEGLGNAFLAEIRPMEILLHVVRCFDDPKIAHVGGGTDPVRDVMLVATELALADLEVLTRRRQKVEKRARTGDEAARKELASVDHLIERLERSQSLASLPDTSDLLTAKPVLYVANIADETTARPHITALEALTSRGSGQVIPINSRLEADLVQLQPEERAGMRRDLGLPAPGLERVVRAAYALLNVIAFFTVNENELRAWTCRAGTPAVEAAATIHSDMGRGFIRAKVVRSADLAGADSPDSLRAHGLERIEGRDYAVRDGDILTIAFRA